jgi:DNA modification methylase
VTPFYADDWLTIHSGDCRTVMAEMEPESVQSVITSPPYFGLRDYGIAPSVWGGETHEHEWGEWQAVHDEREVTSSGKSRTTDPSYGGDETRKFDGNHQKHTAGSFCPCGAWLGVLGLEPTVELYVAHMVEVFRGIRRVLRWDGTVWLNLGDSYFSDTKGSGGTGKSGLMRDGRPEAQRIRTADGSIGHQKFDQIRLSRSAGLKPKDRMMVPARVALALQADGWWLRDEIVWAKPNPMPSSVTDRTTPAHEMVYLLTRSARYFYDAEAIREPNVGTRHSDIDGGPQKLPDGSNANAGRSFRSKKPDGWDTGPGGHGTVHRNGREPGEVAEIAFGRNKRSVWTIPTAPYPDAHFATFPPDLVTPMILAGSRPGDVVLDPFGGSGTVGMVAQMHSRRAVLIDLNPDYLAQCLRRNAQSPLGLDIEGTVAR